MRLRVALVLILTSSMLGAPTASATDHDAARPGVRVDEVVHRVVWDASRRNGPALVLRSANLDGSDERLIYRRKKGWTLWLVMNRVGSEVAMAPFPGRRRWASLVVVDTVDGGHTDLLRNHRRFADVGGIGWSPEGNRLVFEGLVLEHGEPNHYLFTIHRDGTGLKRLVRIRQKPNVGGLTPALAWTVDEGIFYTELGNLMRYDRGKRHKVLERVGTLRISGDGSVLILERFTQAGASLWRMSPDASELTRIVNKTRPHPRAGYILYPTPDYDGELLLSAVDGLADSGIADVVWPAHRAPTRSDPRLDFVGSYLLAWN